MKTASSTITKFQFDRYYKFDIAAIIKQRLKMVSISKMLQQSQIVHVYDPYNKTVENQKTNSKTCCEYSTSVDFNFTK